MRLSVKVHRKDGGECRTTPSLQFFVEVEPRERTTKRKGKSGRSATQMIWLWKGVGTPHSAAAHPFVNLSPSKTPLMDDGASPKAGVRGRLLSVLLLLSFYSPPTPPSIAYCV